MKHFLPRFTLFAALLGSPAFAETLIHLEPAHGATPTQAKNTEAATEGFQSASIFSDGEGNENNGLLQNTGYVVSAGDEFNLGATIFINRYPLNGSGASSARLFTSSDDTITGTLTMVYSTEWPIAATRVNELLEPLSRSAIGSVTTPSVGRQLFISFTNGQGNGRALFLDQVALSTIAP